MAPRPFHVVDVSIFVRFAALVGLTVIIGGCGGHVQGAAYAEADTPVVFSSPPTLVEVDGGVWVARDYDYPVYFVDDDYWVFREGIWYRSHSYEGGWIRIEENVVPMAIARRDHRRYIHYHGAATAQTRAAPRRERGPEPHHDHPEHAGDHHGPPDHAGPSEHAEEHQGLPHHDDAPGRGDDHHGADHHNGPPAHAAQQHGGAPAHNEHPANSNNNKDKKHGKEKGKEGKH